MRLFGLIGYPLGHSFSKKYFTEKFAVEGIKDCQYELFPIERIEDLPAILEANPDLEGLNVTIPYKQQVLPFLDVNYIPTGIEACNCISIRNGKLIGYNTDVIGFEKSFTPLLLANHTQALVLGNGGASAAVTYVLNKLGIGYQIVSRELKLGSDLTYDQLSAEIIADHPVIINTSPLGTYPKIEQLPAIPYNAITSAHYLFDLVYNPAKTAFLQKGEERGAAIQNGYPMLQLQAEAAWDIWNNC